MPALKSIAFAIAAGVVAVIGANAQAAAAPRFGVETSAWVHKVNSQGFEHYDSGRNLQIFKQMPLERILERLRRQRYSDFQRITIRRGVYRIRCMKYGHRYKLSVDAYTGRIIRIRPI